jgi:hypothetical protein
MNLCAYAATPAGVDQPESPGEPRRRVGSTPLLVHVQELFLFALAEAARDAVRELLQVSD